MARHVIIVGLVFVIMLGLLAAAIGYTHKMLGIAEAEVWDVVPESVLQAVCAIGLERGYDYHEYDDAAVGTTVFTLQDIPDVIFNDKILPYIKNKYTQAGIPIEIRFIARNKTGGLDPTTPPVLSDTYDILEVEYKKLGITRRWRVQSAVIKVSDNPQLFRCYVRKW